MIVFNKKCQAVLAAYQAEDGRGDALLVLDLGLDGLDGKGGLGHEGD